MPRRDPAGVDREGRGCAGRILHGITIPPHPARVHAAGVETGNNPVILVNHFHPVVYLDAPEGHQKNGARLCGVESRSPQGAQVLGFLDRKSVV